MASGRIFLAVALSGIWFAAWGIQALPHSPSRIHVLSGQTARGIQDDESTVVDEQHTLMVDSGKSQMASVDGSGNVMSHMRRQDTLEEQTLMDMAAVDGSGNVVTHMRQQKIQRKDDVHATDMPARVLEAKEATHIAENHGSDQTKPADVRDHKQGEAHELSTPVVVRMPSLAHDIESAELKSVLRGMSTPALVILGVCIGCLFTIMGLWLFLRRETIQRNDPTGDTGSSKSGLIPDGKTKTMDRTGSTDAKKGGFFSSFFKKASGALSSASDSAARLSETAGDSYSAARAEKKTSAAGTGDAADGAGDEDDDEEDYDVDDVRPATTASRGKYASSRRTDAKATVSEEPTETEQSGSKKVESRSGDYGKNRKTKAPKEADEGGGGDDEPSEEDEAEDVSRGTASRTRYRDGR